LRRLQQVLVNLQLRLRERYALSSAYDEQLAGAAADAVGPLRASAAVMLRLEAGARVAPRDALQRIAEETASTAARTAVTEARENGSVPAIGATATLVGAIELATQLAERTQSRYRVSFWRRRQSAASGFHHYPPQANYVSDDVGVHGSLPPLDLGVASREDAERVLWLQRGLKCHRSNPRRIGISTMHRTSRGTRRISPR
jgi:hypothetical protein